MRKLKVAVLVSGGGTNLQALIDACKDKKYPAEIVLVLSNKENAYALERAKKAKIPTKVINHKEFETRAAFDKAMDTAICKSGAEFVCMAGFMRLLSEWFVEKWYNKLINIHPSLLPSFKGINAQKQALEFGARITGCTVHFVREEMDAGPIIVQESVKILPKDTVESLTERLLEKEHKSYVQALKLVASGKIEIRGDVAVIRK